MVFAPPQSFLLEFLPTERFASAILEEASMVGQRYMVLPCKSEPPQHNIEVDVGMVRQALREHMTAQSGPPRGPQYHYRWDLKTLQR